MSIDNCFECDGSQTECKNYLLIPSVPDKCLYRWTADEDLKRYKNKEPVIMKKLLKEYIKNEGD